MLETLLKCPQCGHENDRVLETRDLNEGVSIRRRRECLACKYRFNTIESIIHSLPFVIKKDGRREPFTKEKILKGVLAACQKRPISHATMEEIGNQIMNWANSLGEKEISSNLIGQKVIQFLQKLDQVAYVRFASVYRNFEDVKEFVDTLEVSEEVSNTSPSIQYPEEQKEVQP